MQGWHLLSRSPLQNCRRQIRIWPCNSMDFAGTLKLDKSLLVTSIILYGCETWTLLADSEKKIHAFQSKCLKNLLRISYLEHKTNDWVRSKINFLMGLQKPLLTTFKRRKSAWFGHATRNDSLSQTVLQGTMEVGKAVVGKGNA